jgi:antitoxin (DNA-binding transcriptional repressor) of toxin-antitoxin stability system
MDRVAAGDEVVITRHDKPRIRLSPVGPGAATSPPPRGAEPPLSLPRPPHTPRIAR